MARREFTTQVAASVPFDNTGTDFTSDNVQDALEETAASASPGFSFGREGSSGAGTWLRRTGNIESNRTGVTIPISSPVITTIATGTENVATYSVGIYEHEGNSVNLTLLTTISVTSSRTSFTTGLSISATQGRQLAVRCESNSGGNPNNLAVDIVLSGGA